jgi:3-(3-hydroxy-phenyl)propionate hydroxylase
VPAPSSTTPHNTGQAHDLAHVQVAVVGFGPAGAVATGLLGARGITTLAIDRLVDVYDKPRAIALDHEIMRLFDNMGVAHDVMPFVAPFPASQHFGAQGQLIRRIDMVEEPYPLGYTPTMVFTQPPVEEALRRHARHFPSVRLELGSEVVAVEQDSERATLHLRDAEGRTRLVTADYVIACDGASSSVRQQLDITLDDLVFDEPWLVVDMIVHDHALKNLPDTAAQFCDPARPTTFIIGPGNHRRWEIMLLPGEDPRVMEMPEQVWALLSRWLTPEDGTLWRAASYRFHALVASRWRDGRIFLAGDAAHQQPPFIGQGMCQGLRDVSNLVWKLAAVIEGKAPDALLETYGEERAEHVRELTSRIRAIGRVICERDPDAARERDARILAEGGGTPRTITRQEIVPPLQRGMLALKTPASGTLFPQPWITQNSGDRLLDAVAGGGWRLVLHADNPLSLRAVDLADGTGVSVIAVSSSRDSPAHALQERDGVLGRWFAAHGALAAVVRPDHYVYGTAADIAGLETLLAGLVRRLT